MTKFKKSKETRIREIDALRKEANVHWSNVFPVYDYNEYIGFLRSLRGRILSERDVEAYRDNLIRCIEIQNKALAASLLASNNILNRVKTVQLYD